MTREAKLMSGIILTMPTIQYGGYFLLSSLMSKSSGYMENPEKYAVCRGFFFGAYAYQGTETR